MRHLDGGVQWNTEEKLPIYVKKMKDHTHPDEHCVSPKSRAIPASQSFWRINTAHAGACLDGACFADLHAVPIPFISGRLQDHGCEGKD